MTQDILSSSTPKRVIATQEALSLISRLIQENKNADKNADKSHSQIIFVQSGGCCEGSVPICTLRSDFALGEADILISNIGGADFYLHQSMFQYYKSTQLIIDAKEGLGSEYSLEYGSGWKFELSLRLFSDEEIALLWAISSPQNNIDCHDFGITNSQQ